MSDALAAAQLSLQGQTEALARALKETPDRVSAALQAAAPGALASLIGQGETEAGVETVQIALQDAQTGPELLERLGERLDGARLRGRAGGAGTRLLGSRGVALTEQLAGERGLKPASASALVDLTATVVIAALRQTGAAPKDAEATRTLLRRQAPSVNRALPDALRPRFEIVLQPEPSAERTAGSLPSGLWLAAIAAVLVALAVVFWLMFGHAAHAASVSPTGLVYEALNAERGRPFWIDALGLAADPCRNASS